MKKNVNSLKEFKAVLHQSYANHQPHIFDYMGEYPVSPNATTIAFEDDSLFIYQFDSFDALHSSILNAISELDLISGGDDQFYDYNPAILEAIIYGAYILQQNQPIDDLIDALYLTFQKYWDARKTETLDTDDMDDTYDTHQEAISFTNHKILSIKNLEVAQYLKIF